MAPSTGRASRATRGGKRHLRPAAVADVRLTGGLLAERQKVILDHSIEHQYEQCRTTGRIDALKLDWTPDSDKPKPHPFWDSDVAKWIESAGYALMLRPDRELERKVDEVIELLAGAQQPDGYLNSYYSSVEPQNRWTNLRDRHELYCAGHLIEAAVAYYQATGKRRMLDILLRCVDHIDSVFGPEAGKKNGYDGHEEIELALMKLYAVTGDEKHLKLARHFIDARGQQPHFFDIEARQRGEEPRNQPYDYYQAHVPVRQQKTAEGHSVRAMYLFAGAADVAAATGDKALLSACRRVFDNVVDRRMYVTGGIGSSRHGERFTYDFDLPNESAYAETCATIALVFFAQRMLNLDRDGRYADVMEQALYNGVLPGISLDGRSYFYANYLATDPKWHDFEHAYPARRQGWFGCACCPPNVARLLTSLGGYAYSVGDRELAVNLYADSSVSFRGDGGEVTVEQQTKYPWDGAVRLTVRSAAPARFALHLRLPGWCDRPLVRLNGKAVAKDVRRLARKGYLTIDRTWSDGDRIELELPMPPRRIYADVRVRHDTGRVALARGPIVYCLEQVDNGPDLNALRLPRKATLTARAQPRLLGGVVTLEAKGVREVNAPGQGLYGRLPPREKPAAIRAVPYYTWANRKLGEMIVWIRE